jgi:hypothetical protein
MGRFRVTGAEVRPAGRCNQQQFVAKLPAEISDGRLHVGNSAIRRRRSDGCDSPCRSRPGRCRRGVHPGAADNESCVVFEEPLQIVASRAVARPESPPQDFEIVSDAHGFFSFISSE